MRKLSWAILSLILVTASGVLLSGRLMAATGLGTPVYYQGQGNAVGLSVTADSPELARLMQGAFALHGAFALVADSSAKYAVRFATKGPGSVSATVLPHAAGEASFTVEGHGADWREAAYRAGDAVVEKLTHAPGFFAGKLAFVSQRTGTREIYVSDLLGQDVTRITSDHAISQFPSWAPDGSKLLYTGTYKTGFWDIFLINLATKQRQLLTPYQGTNMGGVFSPDGRQVAMILSGTGYPELYVADADGKNIHCLTRTTYLKSSPAWSPDGRQIVLACDPRGSPLLYEVSATGGEVKSLATNISNYCAEPSWNPRDPNLIAFMAEQGGGFLIATLNLGTGEVKTYAAGSEPAWTNDGRHLVYTHHQKGGDQLYLLDTETGKTVALTTHGGSEPAFVYPGP